MTLKLYAPKGHYRANKALIAAQYAGVKVETPAFDAAKPPAHLKEINPIGKVPVLETEHGAIFESNAIARYIARLRNDVALYGATFPESGLVDSWVDFCTHEIEVPLCAWTYPKQKLMDEVPEATKRAKEDLKRSLTVVNEHLLHNTFLVGEQVTLADIVLVASLADGFKLAFDAEFLKPLGNLVRWFSTCVNQPEFSRVLGTVTIPGQAAPAAKAEKKEEKKEAPKPAAKPAPKEEDFDDEEKPKVKEVNPLDLLPPSKLVLDDWKRCYSNTKDLYGTAMKWFWENYDKDGYCLYYTKYQKAEGECKVGFMTSNLLSGFMQRLDKLRRYAFGVMDVVGTAGNFDIQGVWLFRGSEIPFEMKDHPSYEFHTWRKLDHTNAADKQLIADYWCAEESVEGLPIADCKVYK